MLKLEVYIGTSQLMKRKVNDTHMEELVLY